ncbi:MAG: thioredoxin-disulfide reductase [Spirochaetae bacterium HGW-Spirochaetae-4]|jgi:thioredoxin reductase (NADPH)|nr:MAG: thioredoxin-disulfide reductase [Spirochaetes bacterium GWC2_52_13]PKL10701.1 MAG: thioredoxin-disulfide reductase [Spirochaetae bacterium HGW-Spirochaetae-8]PKL20995.1 MAG: thioredoxin-disulfide reductase [Spirochaetae bacterium HGW-Spirochaetae-4]HCG63722.1 thioredoxin-disulfide reductase [Sphaerochaeta sp.]HCS35792.1 thioredoxin-disulfide reductase [Sphaerochaeta sp.]
MSEQEKQPDIIIIGGGPAGLSAAQYAARAGLSAHVFEEMAPGGQILVVDELENYPGFEEPISGFDLADKFTKQAERFGAVIHFGTVDAVNHNEDGSFTVVTTDGTFTVPVVIMSTGAKRRELGVPGEKEYQGRGVSYCATCDGPFFKGKRILVVGGGDSACGESLFLSKLSSDIVIVHRKDRFRAQRSIAGMVEHDGNIDTRFLHTVNEIKGDGKRVTSVSLHDIEHDRDYDEPFDAVFVFIGADPRTKLVSYAGTDEAGYLVTNELMSTDVPGLYAVGDVRNTPFRQIVTAASDGAIAAHASAEYIDELKGQAYV